MQLTIRYYCGRYFLWDSGSIIGVEDEIENKIDCGELRLFATWDEADRERKKIVNHVARGGNSQGETNRTLRRSDKTLNEILRCGVRNYE